MNMLFILKLDDYEIDAFLHFNDLSYSGVPEEIAKNFKLKDKLKVKVLEIKKDTKTSSWFKANTKRSF